MFASDEDLVKESRENQCDNQKIESLRRAIEGGCKRVNIDVTYYSCRSRISQNKLNIINLVSRPSCFLNSLLGEIIVVVLLRLARRSIESEFRAGSIILEPSSARRIRFEVLLRL